MSFRIFAILFGLTMVIAATGCASSPAYQSGVNYRTINVEPLRDTDAARRLNREGLTHLSQNELDNAADAFERALTEDVEFGPAHNNLGKVFFLREDWYHAAWEFEYACRLLPNQAEPFNNLGLVHERVGELDRAIESYRKAASIAPKQIEYRANLARALVRRGDRTEEVYSLLEQILAEDNRPDWLNWARQQQVRMTDR
jgi:Tfp pilus assembly protein PilF